MKNLIKKISKTHTYTLIMRLVVSAILFPGILYLFIDRESRIFAFLGGFWLSIHGFLIGITIASRKEFPIGNNTNLLEGDWAQIYGWLLIIGTFFLMVLGLGGVFLQ